MIVIGPIALACLRRLMSGSMLAALAVVALGSAAYGAEPGHYQPETARSFTVNGWHLAKSGAAVSLSGFYIREGAFDEIYGSQAALFLANSSTAQKLGIVLLTRDASPSALGALLDCRSNPAAANGGCHVQLLGVATFCDLSQVFGAPPERQPCLDVRESAITPAPGPTLAQIQARQREQKEQQERRKQAHARMEQAYKACRHKEHFNPLDLFGATNRCWYLKPF